MKFKQGLWLSLLILTVFWVSQLSLMIVAAKWFGLSEEEIKTLGDPSVAQKYKGDITAIVALGSGLIGILLIVLILKLKRLDIDHFLAFEKFKPKYFLVFLSVWIALLFCIHFLEQNFAIFRNDFTDTTTATSTQPALLLLGIGIIGPAFEELFFRGFLFRVIKDHFSNGNIAVLSTSLLFAVVHLQYNPGVMVLVFSMGLVLGYARLNSKSVHLPIILHILNNSLIAIQLGG